MKTETVTVLNTTRNTVLGERIGVAETSLSRIVGLLGKRGLDPGTGLLIMPSQGRRHLSAGSYSTNNWSPTSVEV